MVDTRQQTPLSLLLVDDDKPFLTRLARAMETRGFDVRIAETVAEGIAQVRRDPPNFAVVDLRLGDGSGLDVIEALHQARHDARAVVLTGYGNIATAVTAVKLGRSTISPSRPMPMRVYGALMAETDTRAALPENPMSADRVRWEHIQRVYELCNRNVSETARRLNMHRRTLQRILAKRAPEIASVGKAWGSARPCSRKAAARANRSITALRRAPASGTSALSRRISAPKLSATINPAAGGMIARSMPGGMAK